MVKRSDRRDTCGVMNDRGCAHQDTNRLAAAAIAHFTSLFDALVPVRCVFCRVHGDHICKRCQTFWGRRSPIYRLPSADAPLVAALGPYAGQLRYAVLNAKFHHGHRAAAMLGEVLGAKLRNTADAVVPVPLHRRRLLERGFNQARSVAEGCARILGVPVVTNAVQRTKATHPQTSLALADRRANVADAFEPTEQARSLSTSRVMLIDDVVTTGATIAACARALREAGVTGIFAAVIAIRV